MAFIWFFLLCNHPKKGGFASTIGANQSNFFSLLQGCGCLDKDHAVTIIFADIIETDHRTSENAGKGMWATDCLIA